MIETGIKSFKNLVTQLMVVKVGNTGYGETEKQTGRKSMSKHAGI
jgi:hypothetical protein